MSLGDHLEELRSRLILAILGLLAGLVVCLFFGSYLMRFMAAPYEFAMEKVGREPVLLAIRPPETFLVYIKVCLLFGLIISSPWVLYQLWTFISSGLYKHERKYIHIIVPVSAGLFITGAIFFIKVIAPVALLFFINFNPGLEFVRANFTLQNYISFVLTLTLGRNFLLWKMIIFY